MKDVFEGMFFILYLWTHYIQSALRRSPVNSYICDVSAFEKDVLGKGKVELQGMYLE